MKTIGFNHIVAKIEEEVSDEELQMIFHTSEDDINFAELWIRSISEHNYIWLAQNPDSTLPPSPLELPRKLPQNLDLSQAVVLIGQTESSCRVFIYNSGSLYHVCDTNRADMGRNASRKARNGYAAIDGKVYLVEDLFQNIRRPDLSLGVSRLDLNTKLWEHNIPKLNTPKVNPTVFVYNKKIYVVSSQPMRPQDQYTLIECLDPLQSTWTKIPNPPDTKHCYSPYMLDTSKGILLCSTLDDKLTKDTNVPRNVLYELNLTSHKWKYHSALPDFYMDVLRVRYPYEGPIPPNASYVFGIPPDLLMAGCTVDNFLFCYDTELTPGAPLIVVYDVSGTGDDHVVGCKINLSDTLKQYDVTLQSSHGYLNHLQGYKFCLVIFYFTDTLPVAKAVCILTFELQRDSVSQSDATAHLLKQRKADKSFFALLPETLQCRRFQLPMDVIFSFCKKMEE